MTGEIDLIHITPLLSLIFTGATLAGVIKVIYWTANHDLRMAQVEKELAAHVDDNKQAHADIHDNYKELTSKVERREKRLILVEHDVQTLMARPIRRETSDDSGVVESRGRAGAK